VPPMTGATSGSLVLYEVCLNVPVPPPCATDAYLIWE